MKKLTILLILSLIFYSNLFGQFNPVIDLSWTHWYSYPNNFFSLTWTAPDTPQDTLIGYNIYRDNDLFRFQQETILDHPAPYCGNALEDFVHYNDGSEFWIHVTAVYNSDSIESNYNDSAYCGGFMISVNEFYNNKKAIFPNPASEKIFIDIPNVVIVLLTDMEGKIIKSFINKSDIDLSNFSNGLYFLKVIADNREYNYKIVIDN